MKQEIINLATKYFNPTTGKTHLIFKNDISDLGKVSLKMLSNGKVVVEIDEQFVPLSQLEESQQEAIIHQLNEMQFSVK